VVSDVYGAYHYSGSRIQILQQYYDKLKPGGEGFVLFHSVDTLYDGVAKKYVQSSHGPSSIVLAQGGQSVSLEKYLVSKFPANFEISQTGQIGPSNTLASILHIKKPVDTPPIHIGSKLKEKSKYFETLDDYHLSQLPPLKKQASLNKPPQCRCT